MANHDEREHDTMPGTDVEALDLQVEDLTSQVELNQDWCCVATIGCFLCVGGTVGTSGTFGSYCLEL